jgi:hypothetical protein
MSTPSDSPLSPAAGPDPYEHAWDVVLARTPRGEDELRKPLLPLTPPQQEILLMLDGESSLRELAALRSSLRSARLSRDAARLLAFGLVRQVRGEFPRDLVVSAMNLTMKLPVGAFRPQPRAASTPSAPSSDARTAEEAKLERHASDRASRPGSGLRWLPLAAFLLLAALAVAAYVGGLI